MSLIKILPENLANQIAAGEVVERPASVVKELLENSLDAGAASIAVQIENAGTGLIRVVDDGRGMDEDDILLSLERHATSKLSRVEQLDSITTLGFRGEAIPSIASVSKMTITSRNADSPLGNRAEVSFGKVFKVHEMGAAPGTAIEVRNLFGNVPARRKFLKSGPTEIAHIDEVVRSYALVNNLVGFSLQVNGRIVFDWDTDEDEILRATKVMGGTARQLTALSNGDSEPCAVRGYLPAPDPNAAKTAKLWLFVNGRSVKDKVVGHAVNEGMRGFLMKGRRAAGVVFLEVPAGQVDVNVHPAKQEVRFRKANLIHKAVEEAVRRAMLDFQQQRKEDLFGSAGGGPVETAPLPTHRAAEVAQPEPAAAQLMSEVSDAYDHDRTVDSASHLFPPSDEVKPATPPEAPKTLFVVPETSEALPAGTRYVGQFMDTYLIFEVESGIAVIDQHAAQERLLFEKLKKSFESREMASQVLMFPEMIDLTPNEMEILEQNGTEISFFGLDLDHFGGSSFLIKAIPVLMKHVPPAEMFRELLARFGQDGRGGKRYGIDDILASMACKAAIKAGMVLSREEAERLLCQIRQAGIFSHCPHGRPVVKIFAPQDIKKWFSRT